MKPGERQAFFKRVLVVTWGMVTLVLVFCIGILVYEMVQNGYNPLGFTEQQTAPTPRIAEPAEPVTTEEILLYFADDAARSLLPEPRQIELTEYAVDSCRRALEALIAGPRDRDTLRPVLSEATKIRALYLLEDGELVVDFSGEFVVEHKKLRSASFEALMIHAIVHTLTQQTLLGATGQPIRTVRLLVDGAPPPASFPAHVDVSEPIGPDSQWLQATAL